MSASIRKVCFVTSEIYPLTAGGIGRLVHNSIRDGLRRRLPVEFHVLVPCWSEIEPRAMEATFGDKVTFHKAVSLDDPRSTLEYHGSYPPRWAFTDTVNHADSLEIMLELKRLENEGTSFDVVEFNDYLGWGYSAIQEKRMGLAFQATDLAVRLHGTAGIIHKYEGGAPSLQEVALWELERKSLQDADLVVAHLPIIADEYKRHYGFNEKWADAVRVEFPPVIDQPLPAEPKETNRDLVFLTKIQRCKRPDLFVKGASQFLLANPEYTGRVILACHVSNEEYGAAIRAMVPSALNDRFLFSGPKVGREQLMARGIVVVSSDYESLNLTAYEAAQAGAVLVLNGACPAFGKGTPFIDGENCHLFDGSIDDLARAMKRAWQSPPPKRVEWTVDLPYYAESHARPAPRLTKAGKGRVSVLITNYNLARYLPQTLTSVAASTHSNIEVILVDDASTDPLDREVLSSLENQRSNEMPVKVVRNPVNRGLPAARNIGLQHCTGDYVLPLDADDCINPRFLELAVRALQANREFDIVTPTTGYFQTDEALEERVFSDYACFLGDVPTLGMFANRFSCATSLMRRSLFERFQYDEKLNSYEDWALYLRLAQSGVRFLVTNEINFYYRRRPGSMIAGVNHERHQRLLSRMYETLPQPLPPSVRLEAVPMLLTMWKNADPVPTQPSHEQAHHSMVDRINLLVKRQPILHKTLKVMLSAASFDDSRPLRHELADRMKDVIDAMPSIFKRS